jgi:hypothetical protein
VRLDRRGFQCSSCEVRWKAAASLYESADNMEDGSCAAVVRLEGRWFLCSSSEFRWKMVPVQRPMENGSCAIADGRGFLYSSCDVRRKMLPVQQQ